MDTTTRKLILMAVALLPLLPAAAQQTDPDVIWKGDFEAGASSLTGHCASGDDQFCATQTIRSQQIQVVQDPVAQGRYAARFEVKFGDVYSNYSDSRSVITGPISLWENEGNERWYRWQALWPQDWVGSYPKWDQLSIPSARSWGGSLVEWHHDANGGVEHGSAPLYIGADDSNIWLCLVNQSTSECRENLTLAPLQRSHWHDFILHARWSPNASVGYLEMWIDGVNVLPKHPASNMYPGMRNYLIVGLYRNGRIGDPNLRYPDGTHVYGTNGTPGVAYLDGLIVGKTQQSVLSERPWGTPDAGPEAPADGGADASVDPPALDVDGGTPGTDAGTPVRTGLAAVGYPAGCSSTGPQLGWFALPLLAGAVARRRLRRRAPG
jgi:polysaccharide lyase-like protein